MNLGREAGDVKSSAVALVANVCNRLACSCPLAIEAVISLLFPEIPHELKEAESLDPGINPSA